LTVIVALGIFFAWAVYSRGRIDAYAPDRLAGLPGNLFSYMNRGWLVDELYQQLFVKPYYWLTVRVAWAVDWQFWHDFVHDNVLVEPFRATAAFLANPIDLGFVDGIVNRLAKLIQGGSGELRRVQTGYVRNYALSILLGVVAVLAWLVLRQ
jgi:NADH-quinone oxidoreductase subunit L